MRTGVILLAFAVVGYGAWGHIKTGSKTIEPLYAEPYLVVYGRESCGFTMDLVRKLERQGDACPGFSDTQLSHMLQLECLGRQIPEGGGG